MRDMHESCQGKLQLDGEGKSKKAKESRTFFFVPPWNRLAFCHQSWPFEESNLKLVVAGDPFLKELAGRWRLEEQEQEQRTASTGARISRINFDFF